MSAVNLSRKHITVGLKDRVKARANENGYRRNYQSVLIVRGAELSDTKKETNK